MKKIHKIAALTLALGMGLAALSGCGAADDAAGVWRHGVGAPDSALGADGDLYLDENNNVWTKENGVWTEQGKITGEQETGGGWRYGNGAPAADLGKNGDLYLDLETWDVYAKDGGAWTFRDNINSNSAFYSDFFKKMTLTEGDLLVLPASEFSTVARHLFAASVQGLFAQVGESKYYLDCGGKDTVRLDEIRTKYHKQTAATTLDEMCSAYKTNFSSGYVLYDATDNQSMNCARTIAGARQLVMVDETMADWAAEQGLEECIDATEMTAEQCFDAFHDELDNTGIIQEKGYGYTDYAIACRYFSYYPEGDPDTNGSAEHPLPPQDAFQSVREKVLAWCDGGPVFGDFPLGEYGTVKVNSYYDHPTVVGSGSANVTVTACLDAFGKDVYMQPNKPTDKALSLEDYPLNKHYVTVVNGDGDNVGCWFGGTFDADGTNGTPHYMGGTRGNFPMGWEINPSLAAMAPAIVESTYSTAKAGDTFVCSIAGFGHSFLRYFSDRALKRYTYQLNKYIEKIDCSIVKILDDGSIQDEGRVIEAFSQMSNAEGFYYCTYGGAYKDDHGAVRWSQNGKPVVSCRYTLWDSFDTGESAAQQINASPADSTKIDGYSFVNLHLWSKDYGEVETMVSRLDKNKVQVVDPITFLRLIKARVPHVDATPAQA